MNRAQPLVFAGASAQSEHHPDFSTQRLVNVFVADRPNSDYSAAIYLGAAGLRPVVDLGGPVRAMLELGDKLYVVANSQLWSIDRAGVATPEGNVPDARDTIIEGNGDTVLITTGDVVSAFSIQTGQMLGVQNLPNASSVAYIDNFAIFTEPGVGRFWVSDVGNLDFVDGLSFATAETDEDDLVRAFVDHREIWLFGKDTTEVWYVSGDADLPVSRSNDATLEKGCAAKMSVQKLSNTVFWVGSDRVVYAASGYVPQPISGPNLNQILEAMTEEELGRITSSVWTEQGREMYALHIEGRPTWVFDTTSSQWWERATDLGEWVGVCATRFALEQYIGGTDGVVYIMDENTFTDGGRDILRHMVSAPLGDGNRRIQHRYLRADMGRSTVGSTITLEVSEDGVNWRTPRDRIISGDQSLIRCNWNNLGQSRWRIYKLSCVSAGRFYIRNCLIGIVGGRD